MAADTIALERLQSQRLLGNSFDSAAECVEWFGATQAQDFHGSKWSIGQRTTSLTDAKFNEAFDRGEILRTHAMRPTWHFVAPSDLGWIQRLTSSRVHTANGHQYRLLEIDQPLLRRSRGLIEKALGKRSNLTRPEIGEILAGAGIVASGPRLAYLIMNTELEGTVCSGPLRGKQFTYSLTDARVKRPRDLAGDEALAELARRYFQSHGPATVHDFAWWSGLTMANSRRGLAAIENTLVAKKGEDSIFFQSPEPAPRKPRIPRAHLVSIYDEHLIAYKDRRHAYLPEVKAAVASAAATMIALVLINGVIVGMWQKIDGKTVRVRCTLFRKLSESESVAVHGAATRYSTFLSKPVNLEL